MTTYCVHVDVLSFVVDVVVVDTVVDFVVVACADSNSAVDTGVRRVQLPPADELMGTVPSLAMVACYSQSPYVHV